MLVKKCRFCGKFFELEGKPPNFIDICKECLKNKYNRWMFVDTIKKTRYIGAEMFDLWDTEFKTKYGFERVCRYCGRRLLRKDGTYSPYKRYCSPECSEKLAEHQFIDLEDFYDQRCEICGVNNVEEVHHIFPVYLVDFDNLDLIFDKGNLIGVCKECHLRLHKAINIVLKTQQVQKEYVTLDKFM